MGDSGKFLYQQSGVPAGTYGAIMLSSGPVHSATIAAGGYANYWQIDAAGSNAINLVNNFTATAWINYNNGWYDTVIRRWLGAWWMGLRRGWRKCTNIAALLRMRDFMRSFAGRLLVRGGTISP